MASRTDNMIRKKRLSSGPQKRIADKSDRYLASSPEGGLQEPPSEGLLTPDLRSKRHLILESPPLLRAEMGKATTSSERDQPSFLPCNRSMLRPPRTFLGRHHILAALDTIEEDDQLKTLMFPSLGEHQNIEQDTDLPKRRKLASTLTNTAQAKTGNSAAGASLTHENQEDKEVQAILKNAKSNVYEYHFNFKPRRPATRRAHFNTSSE